MKSLNGKIIVYLLLVCFVGSVTLEPVIAAPVSSADLNKDGKINHAELKAANARLQAAYSYFDSYLAKAKADAPWKSPAESRAGIESERQKMLSEEERYNSVVQQAASEGLKITDPSKNAKGELIGGLVGLVGTILWGGWVTGSLLVLLSPFNFRPPDLRSHFRT